MVLARRLSRSWRGVALSAARTDNSALITRSEDPRVRKYRTGSTLSLMLMMAKPAWRAWTNIPGHTHQGAVAGPNVGRSVDLRKCFVVVVVVVTTMARQRRVGCEHPKQPVSGTWAGARPVHRVRYQCPDLEAGHFVGQCPNGSIFPARLPLWNNTVARLLRLQAGIVF
jgi:hypothetical protein